MLKKLLVTIDFSEEKGVEDKYLNTNDNENTNKVKLYKMFSNVADIYLIILILTFPYFSMYFLAFVDLGPYGADKVAQGYVYTAKR